MRNQRDRQIDDEDIILKMQAGRLELFAVLAERYKKLISWRARKYTGNPQELEDLIQEGYLGLFLAARSYSVKKGVMFSTYAGICIQNQITNAIRQSRGKKHQPLNTALQLNEDAEAELYAGKGPEELWELKGDYQQLVTKIQELLTAMEYRVLRIYLSNIKRSEVYEKTGISIKSYDNALIRVRKKLRSIQPSQ